MAQHTHFASSKNPVFFIAEVGGNHEGSVDAIRALHTLALSSGADAVKYQLYRGDTLVSRVEGADRNQHFKRFELPLELYAALAEEADKAGVDFMASTWDPAWIPWADERSRMHKVGSGDLTAYPLIKALVATGKPIILSTGLATLADVEAAVAFIERTDRRYLDERKLAILQCTSAYPCPDEDANLETMVALRERFGLPVGFSDHTEGSVAIEAAVALGAEIIEKHFTDTREGKTFRDHKVSLTSAEVRETLARMRRIVVMRGAREKRPTAAEENSGHVTSFRRSVYAAKPLRAGTVLTAEDLTVLRPAHGIAASRFDDVVGRRLRTARDTHEVLRDEDLGDG